MAFTEKPTKDTATFGTGDVLQWAANATGARVPGPHGAPPAATARQLAAAPLV